jgi:hypothetical protein
MKRKPVSGTTKMIILGGVLVVALALKAVGAF